MDKSYDITEKLNKYSPNPLDDWNDDEDPDDYCFDIDAETFLKGEKND